MSAKKKSMDQYLVEVFKQFIAIKDDDYKRSLEVFRGVFDQVKQKMGEQCNYFKKYSSQHLLAGSVSDGIKITKMDEFDMDIVIRLPIHYGDGEDGIIIENQQPGFVKLKIMNAFDNLDKQKEWENCHKVTREWRDSDKYFLQNRFRRWMHGIVQRALNVMEEKVEVNGTLYLLKYKESGPAYTLNIRNNPGDEEFLLDVDLVPVIKFMLPRAPDGYRVIEGAQAKDWLVVPKPNKAMGDNTLKNRCWRLSFQEQERELIKGCLALKMTIRLVKKLRDSLELKSIASYYIKTLFLWKVDEKKNDKTYWQGKVSILFKTMVEELYAAITKKNIPYFWNSKHNLIEGLKPTVSKVYSDRLKDVLTSITANDPDKVVSYLLTKDELKDFKNTEFYQKQAQLPNMTPQISVDSEIVTDGARLNKLSSELDELTLLRAKVHILSEKLESVAKQEDMYNNLVDKMEQMAGREAKLIDLVDRAFERVNFLEDRVKRLERQTFTDPENSMADLVGGARSLALVDSTTSALIDF